MDVKSFIVYMDWEDKLSILSDEDFGKLFRSMFSYLRTGELPNSTPMVNLAFGFLKGALDADREKYRTRCIRNSENINKRWERDGRDKNLNADRDTKKDTKAVPNDTTGIRNDTTSIRSDTKAVPNDTTRIPEAYQTPVITDNLELITDNYVSTNVDTTSCCAEPETGSTQKQPKPAAADAVFKLPLADKTEYGITQAQVNEWANLYPNVDIFQALRAMLGWLQANPDRKKTRRGITRFINGWLAKDQDRGRNRRTANSPTSPDRPLDEWEQDWMEELSSQRAGLNSDKN